MPTTVVHCMKNKYDVYIGRGKCPQTGQPSIWGNPFSYKETSQAQFKVANLEESISRYKSWIVLQSQLILRLPELRDKILGCWCKPAACHGDTLAALADAIPVRHGLEVEYIDFLKDGHYTIVVRFPDGPTYGLISKIETEAKAAAVVNRIRQHLEYGGKLDLNNNWKRVAMG